MLKIFFYMRQPVLCCYGSYGPQRYMKKEYLRSFDVIRVHKATMRNYSEVTGTPICYFSYIQLFIFHLKNCLF